MENKDILILKINKEVKNILSLVEKLDIKQLHFRKDDKWSVAENLIHLNKSVSPINMALSLPKFAFLAFGKAKESEGSESVIERYKAALASGGKASKPYMPGTQNLQLDNAALGKEFKEHYELLTKKLLKWSESDLDTYKLPHPLIGKITVRDMIFFTTYHLEHHFKIMNTIPLKA